MSSCETEKTVETSDETVEGVFVPGWLLNWWKKEGRRHRTLNYGNTLACPEVTNFIDICDKTRTQFCPLCGKNLGESSEDSNDNLVWEN